MATKLHSLIDNDGFRLRGTEMSRIDGFSDVVFGFALTLLVVSLEVPKNYNELHEMLRGFVPFAISFLLLMMVWFAHYTFFRRYGVHDNGTIWLNSILLFVVLFYVYPLKFLFTLMVSGMLGLGGNGITEVRQIPELMVLYGLGFATIYFLIALLYWNGYRQREKLELTEVEQTLSRWYVVEAAGVAAVGLISCAVALALPAGQAGLAGFAYILIGPFKTWHGFMTGRRLRNAAQHSRAHDEPV